MEFGSDRARAGSVGIIGSDAVPGQRRSICEISAAVNIAQRSGAEPIEAVRPLSLAMAAAGPPMDYRDNPFQQESRGSILDAYTGSTSRAH